MAAVGYGRLSVDSIVKRAAVSKAAVYRRWPSKADMVAAMIAEVATRTVDMPDTGSLRGDLVAFHMIGTLYFPSDRSWCRPPAAREHVPRQKPAITNTANHPGGACGASGVGRHSCPRTRSRAPRFRRGPCAAIRAAFGGGGEPGRARACSGSCVLSTV
ncbi:helix-turn-helix domain-containing protein [Streptomyces sp. NPDC091204]|uniref:helix-turn-helix domain-containing protein n=1 Tax=Streptomyces sp. NPDC091204 TaxID=3155299 RepID=UPI0034411074